MSTKALDHSTPESASLSQKAGLRESPSLPRGKVASLSSVIPKSQELWGSPSLLSPDRVSSRSDSDVDNLDDLDDLDDLEDEETPSEQPAPRINWKRMRECTLEEFNQGFLDPMAAWMENPDLTPEQFVPGPAHPKEANLEQSATRAMMLTKVLVSNMTEWKQALFLQCWPTVYLLIVTQLPDSLSQDEKAAIAQIKIAEILSTVEGLPKKFVPVIPEQLLERVNPALKKSEPAIQEFLNSTAKSQALALKARERKAVLVPASSQRSSSGPDWSGYLWTAFKVGKAVAPVAIALSLACQFPIVGAEPILNGTSAMSTALVPYVPPESLGGFCPANFDVSTALAVVGSFVTGGMGYLSGLLGYATPPLVDGASTALVLYGSQSVANGFCPAILSNVGSLLGSTGQHLLTGTAATLALNGSQTLAQRVFPSVFGNLTCPAVLRNLTNPAILGNLTDPAVLPNLTSSAIPNIVPDAVESAATLGWGQAFWSVLGYIPPVVGTLRGLKGLGRAALNRDPSLRSLGPPFLDLARAGLSFAAQNPTFFLPPSFASYLEGIPRPLRTIAAGAVSTALTRVVSTPAIEAVAPEGPTTIYKRANVRTKKGTFDIEVPGPKGLSKDEEEHLIQVFIKERIEKCKIPTQVGDKLNFSNDDERTWSVTKLPVKPDAFAGRESELTQTEIFTDAPEHRSDLAKHETLRELMGGAKGPSVLTNLKAIATRRDDIPLNAASRAPVGFKGGNSQFAAAMQMVLANSELREAMRRSKHPELKKIGDLYHERMERADNELIDLDALLKQMDPGPLKWAFSSTNLANGEPHGVDLYTAKILDLIRTNDPTPGECAAFLAKLSIPRSSQPTARDEKWAKALASPGFPEISVPTDGTTHLQAAFGAFLDQGNAQLNVDEAGAWKGVAATDSPVTQFNGIPPSIKLRFKKAAPGTKIQGSMEHLEMHQQHIRSVNPPEAPLRYRLGSFIVEAGGTAVAYTRMTEVVNGEIRETFWKINPSENNGHPASVDRAAFLAAAADADEAEYSHVDFVGPSNARYFDYEPVVRKFDDDAANNHIELKSDPGLSRAAHIPPVVPPLLLDDNAPVLLHDAITLKEALEGQLEAGHTVLQIPGPSDGYNTLWSLRIMWYAVQEYLHKNPGRKIQLILPAGADRKKTAEAVEAIQRAIGNPPNFDFNEPIHK